MDRRIVLRFVGAIVVSAPVMVAACGGGGAEAGGGGGSDTTIEVADVLFRPDDTTIKVGETVAWEWSGRLPHQVVGTFNGTEIKSEKLTGSGTFTHTFDAPGVFDYVCGVHGIKMAGKITVE